MTQIKTQGIVEELNSITIEKMKANGLLATIKQELEQSDLYLRIQKGQEVIKELETREKELKEQGKQILLEQGVKKFEALDGTVIQLNSKPGKLIIEDDTLEELGEYTRVKTTTSIDKTKLKKDIKEGLLIDGVYIEEDYNLVIKNK